MATVKELEKLKDKAGTYRPSNFNEEDMVRKFHMQKDDARRYFLQVRKPQLDRAYKLYMADNSDRAEQIKDWQSNVFVPYIHSVVETMMPRVIDARPEFSVKGRSKEDQTKASVLQDLLNYNWEIGETDDTFEELVRSTLIHGTGFLQTYWRKDEEKKKYLKTQDINSEDYDWEERTETTFDAPYVDWVDNYSLWYDWHNTKRDNKQYWFKRQVLTGQEIKRRYNMATDERLGMALASNSGDLTDYAAVRNEVKRSHEDVYKGASSKGSHHTYNEYQNRNFREIGIGKSIYQSQTDPDLQMHEVFEWWRPKEDQYAVFVNDVPILKGGSIPNPYDHKETPFIEVPYLRPPNEFEGVGIPLILENPQLMLNMIKNQRLDAVTLNIHKMWIVNPMANIDKSDLVTRPFGIIYSQDPGGVQPVEFSGVDQSAYQEEEMLKSDMRYASGVDDFSMGGGGQGSVSATEVRHLRESTLERVRLFVNHLGSGLADVMRHWIDMYRQFGEKEFKIRVAGEDGKDEFPVVSQDDLEGEYDFEAEVIPSIAGRNDMKKKQSMDLFQLLVNMPFIDPKKLTSKVLSHWDWNLNSLTKDQKRPGAAAGPGGQAGPGGMPPEIMAMMQGQSPEAGSGSKKGGTPSMEQMNQEIQKMMQGGGEQSAFAGASTPTDLLEAGAPPTAPDTTQEGAGGGAGGPGPNETTNQRGHNRNGEIDTSIKKKDNSNPESEAMSDLYNENS